jgi:hypothetical protein
MSEDTTFTLIAEPGLLLEGEFKGHLETVTFVAVNANDMHKWWSVNVGSFEKDFSRIVLPSVAIEIVKRLRAGETVEFPGRYELREIKGFGGSWR